MALEQQRNFDLRKFDSNKVSFDEFLEISAEVPSEQREKWFQASLKLDKMASKNMNYGISRIRAGKLSNKPIDPHLALFSLYMKKDPNDNNPNAFIVDFQQGLPPINNKLAEMNVGLGEIAPATADECTILDAEGNVKCENAERTINFLTGRIDYCDKSLLYQNPPVFKRIPIHTGDRINITTTISPDEAEKKFARLKNEYDEIKKTRNDLGFMRATLDPNSIEQRMFALKGTPREAVISNNKVEVLPRPTYSVNAIQKLPREDRNKILSKIEITIPAGYDRMKTASSNVQEKAQEILDKVLKGDYKYNDAFPFKTKEGEFLAMVDPHGGPNDRNHDWHPAITVVKKRKASVEQTAFAETAGFFSDFSRGNVPEKNTQFQSIEQKPEEEYYPLTRLSKTNNQTFNEKLEALTRREPGFISAFNGVCKRLGIAPIHLLNIINKESGLSAQAQNPKTKATGLIQFMPATAKGLKTTVDLLHGMSATEQLKYVEDYFRPYVSKMIKKDYADLYLAVFYPAALGKPDYFVLGSEIRAEEEKKERWIRKYERKAEEEKKRRIRKIAEQNPGIASPGELKITVGAFRKYANRHKMSLISNNDYNYSHNDALPNLPKEDSLLEARKLPEKLEKLINIARSFKGSKKFRGTEVEGGRLACALVVTTALKKAGIVREIALNVNQAEETLRKNGWTKHSKPQAGDIAIFGKTSPSLRNGEVVQGHKHIGIMTTEKLCLNNSSSQKTPVETVIDPANVARGVYFLRAPI